MTAHAPMTDAELLDLGHKLETLRDSLPSLGEWTATAYLAEADYQALQAAKVVVDRLYRWQKWPARAAESGSYLPAPALAAAPEPQSLRVDEIACPDCGYSTRAHGDRFSRVCENDECPRVFVNVPQPVQS